MGWYLQGCWLKDFPQYHIKRCVWLHFWKVPRGVGVCGCVYTCIHVCAFLIVLGLLETPLTMFILEKELIFPNFLIKLGAEAYLWGQWFSWFAVEEEMSQLPSSKGHRNINMLLKQKDQKAQLSASVKVWWCKLRKISGLYLQELFNNEFISRKIRGSLSSNSYAKQLSQAQGEAELLGLEGDVPRRTVPKEAGV